MTHARTPLALLARFAAAAMLTLPIGCGDGGDGGDDDVADTDVGSDASDGDTGDGSGDAADSEDTGDTRVVFESGRAELVVDTADMEIALRFDGEPRAVLGHDAFQLGVVARFDAQKSYDPTGFFAPGGMIAVPPLDHWSVVSSMAADGSGVDLEFDDGRTARLDVLTVGDGRFSLELVPSPDETEEAVVYLRVRATVDEGERYYGLGEVFDQVEHRGTVRPMQLEIDELESANNEAHVPVPFVTGTNGWGLFVASYRPGVFDVAAADATRLDAVFGTGSESSDGLDFYLFAAEMPLDITRHYYEVTGYPAIPARWALGPLVWRDENDSETQFRADVDAIRDLDLATTGMWIDRPYATAVGAFDWKPGQWTDAAAMIADARALGIRVGLWNVPYLDESAETTAELLAEAEGAGFFPPRVGLLLNRWGRTIDLTNADAYAWWQELIREYIDDGIEGFKLDYAEDIVVGPLGGRTFWEFSDGSTDLTMHARFQRLYHRVYSETLPESGGFLLCRGGTWGDQVDASIIWPGDLSADFARHGEEVETEDGSYLSVGGLPAAMIAGLSLGPSGFPLYGSDTGGYRHSPPDKETFTRWFEITALSPVMQVGTSTNDVAWEFRESNGFDEEMLGWYRRYTRLHLRLWPYTWTYLQRISTDGRTIQRPIGLAYPDDGEHRSDEFLLGDALLVAPVVERGATEREVWFPSGEWVDWWDGTVHAGPGTEVVAAPLDHLPLYSRSGAVVPLLRDTIDAMAPVEDAERVDSYATSPGILTVRATDGPESTFTLFDGATIGQRSTDAGVELTFAAGDEFTAGVRFELTGRDERPGSVTLGGTALDADDNIGSWSDATVGWTWTEEAGGTVVIQATGSSATVVVGN